jgi:peptidoglycan/LPS O-acetylase OafA/YrhL
VSVSLPAGRGQRVVYHTLDAIRGLAAFAVVLRHTEPLFGPNPFFYSYLAVDVFFVMSGFVLAQAYDGPLAGRMSARHFLGLRLIRLYPLYWLGLAVSVASVLATGDHPPGATPENLPLLAAIGLLMLPVLSTSVPIIYPLNLPSWSLFLEVIANAAYSVLHPVLSSRVILGICGVSLACLAVFACTVDARALNLGWTLKSLPIGLARVCYSFFAGVLLFRLFRARRTGAEPRTSTVLSVLVAAAVVACLAAPRLGLPTGVYDVVVVGLAFPALVYAAALVNPGPRLVGLFSFLGLVSYAIYVLHVPAFHLAEHGLARYAGLDLAAHRPAGGFAILALLVALCWLADRLYDIPLRRWLVARLRRSTR